MQLIGVSGKQFMKKQMDNDGYESGGPVMWGWRLKDHVLPPAAAMQRLLPVKNISISIEPFYLQILESEANRRHKAPEEIASGILRAHLEALQ